MQDSPLYFYPTARLEKYIFHFRLCNTFYNFLASSTAWGDKDKIWIGFNKRTRKIYIYKRKGMQIVRESQSSALQFAFESSTSVRIIFT